MEDLELIEKAKKGSSESLEKLMTKYKNLVTIIARKYFIIGADLDDVVQEGMIGLFNAYNNYSKSKNASFKTFSTLCINRQIITAIKKANKQKNLKLLEDISFGEDSYSLLDVEIINPEEQIIDKEKSKYIKDEINKRLTLIEKQVLIEFLKNKSYDEIAKDCNITKKSVDNALVRVRSKLKFLIEN